MIKRRRPGRQTVEKPRQHSPLHAARSFVVPHPVISGTLDVLQRAGEHACEAFVLWGAIVDEDTVTFTTMLVPEQTAHGSDDGLLVTVDGNALFEINKTLYQRGQILAAQVHSHPTPHTTPAPTTAFLWSRWLVRSASSSPTSGPAAWTPPPTGPGTASSAKAHGCP